MTSITLPWPDSKLVNHSAHHYRTMRPIIKKHREWAMLATKAVCQPLPPGKNDVFISIVFYPPSRRIDRLNMPAMLKPYADGIADALGINDRRFHPRYYFAEPVEDARVVFTITEE